MSVPYASQPSTQQSLAWIGGSVHRVVLEAAPPGSHWPRSGPRCLPGRPASCTPGMEVRAHQRANEILVTISRVSKDRPPNNEYFPSNAH